MIEEVTPMFFRKKEKKTSSSSEMGRVINRFKKNHLAVLGLIIVVLIIMATIIGPFFSPYPPGKQNFEVLLAPPSAEHLMGTDSLGRDVFSRIIFGARYTMLIGVGVVAVVAFVGTVLGLIAGYYGGKIDFVLMRLVDMLLSIPALVLALGIAGALGGGLINMIVAIGAVGWTQFARLVRGEVLSIKNNDYVTAARALGGRNSRIIIRHIIPNIIAPMIVFTTLYIPSAILWAAALSFLGLGVQPPTPEWGALIAEGRGFIHFAWWISTFPGLAIMITVLGFNFMGDGLRDAFDPKMGKEL